MSRNTHVKEEKSDEEDAATVVQSLQESSKPGPVLLHAFSHADVHIPRGHASSNDDNLTDSSSDSEDDDEDDDEGRMGNRSRRTLVDGTKRREPKPRAQLTQAQKMRLALVFRLCKRPEKDLLRWLGTDLSMTPRKVRVWFQNQRARERFRSFRDRFKLSEVDPTFLVLLFTTFPYLATSFFHLHSSVPQSPIFGCPLAPEVAALSKSPIKPAQFVAVPYVPPAKLDTFTSNFVVDKTPPSPPTKIVHVTKFAPYPERPEVPRSLMNNQATIPFAGFNASPKMLNEDERAPQRSQSHYNRPFPPSFSSSSSSMFSGPYPSNPQVKVSSAPQNQHYSDNNNTTSTLLASSPSSSSSSSDSTRFWSHLEQPQASSSSSLQPRPVFLQQATNPRHALHNEQDLLGKKQANLPVFFPSSRPLSPPGLPPDFSAPPVPSSASVPPSHSHLQNNGHRDARVVPQQTASVPQNSNPPNSIYHQAPAQSLITPSFEALQAVVARGEAAHLRALLEEDKDTKKLKHFIFNLVCVAAAEDELHCFDVLLSSQQGLADGALWNGREHAMHVVCLLTTSPRFLDILIKRARPNLNVRNANGQTPLHAASLNPNPTVLMFFLENYGQYLEISSRDQSGLTPLHTAVTKFHIHHCMLLLLHGSPVGPINLFTGNSPLHDIVSAPFPDDNIRCDLFLLLWDFEEALMPLSDRTYTFPPPVATALPPALQRDAWLASRNFDGDTVLHLACSVAFASPDIIKMLVELGFKPDVPNNRRQTPLDLARALPNPHILSSLSPSRPKPLPCPPSLSSINALSSPTSHSFDPFRHVS